MDAVFSTESDLYRPDLVGHEEEYYNLSSAELNFQGVPKGFYPGQIEGRNDDGFPVTVSTSADSYRAAVLLKALDDGKYLDWQTSSLDIQVTAFNADLRVMAFSTITFQWDEGGSIRFTATSPLTANWDIGARNIAVIVAFVVLIVVLGELSGFSGNARLVARKLFRWLHGIGSALGNVFLRRKTDGLKRMSEQDDNPIKRSRPLRKLRGLESGDVMELVILGCLVAGVICHGLAMASAAGAALSTSYPIYDSPQTAEARFFLPLREDRGPDGKIVDNATTTEGSEASFSIDPDDGISDMGSAILNSSSSSNSSESHQHRWQLPSNTSGVNALNDMFVTLSRTVYMSDLGYTFHSYALVLSILRLLGRWRFQPHIGFITRTLELAAPDLLALMVVTSVVLVLLASALHLIVGSIYGELSTPGGAIRFFFFFLITGDMGNLHRAVAAYQYGTEQSMLEAVSAHTAYVLLTLLIGYTLLSFLLAIVSDHYTDVVQNEFSSRPSMFDEVGKILLNNEKQIMYGIPVLAKITKHLRGSSKASSLGYSDLSAGSHGSLMAPPMSSSGSNLTSITETTSRVTAHRDNSEDIKLLVHTASVYLMERKLRNPAAIEQCAETLGCDLTAENGAKKLHEALWAFTKRHATADDAALVEAVRNEEAQLTVSVVRVENMTWQLEGQLREISGLIGNVEQMCEDVAACLKGLSSLHQREPSHLPPDVSVEANGTKHVQNRVHPEPQFAPSPRGRHLPPLGSVPGRFQGSRLSTAEPSADPRSRSSTGYRGSPNRRSSHGDDADGVTRSSSSASSLMQAMFGARTRRPDSRARGGTAPAAVKADAALSLPLPPDRPTTSVGEDTTDPGGTGRRARDSFMASPTDQSLARTVTSSRRGASRNSLSSSIFLSPHHDTRVWSVQGGNSADSITRAPQQQNQQSYAVPHWRVHGVNSHDDLAGMVPGTASGETVNGSRHQGNRYLDDELPGQPQPSAGSFQSSKGSAQQIRRPTPGHRGPSDSPASTLRPSSVPWEASSSRSSTVQRDEAQRQTRRRSQPRH